MDSKKVKNKFFKKIKNKYRLVILNDASFEEKLSIKLSPLNTFIITFSAAVLLILFVTIVIAYTPLRESIPGYTDVSLRKELTALVLKSDSLEKELEQNHQYIKNISAILRGELPETGIDDQIVDATVSPGNPNIKSKEDSSLREYVEREETFSLNSSKDENGNSGNKVFYFPPLIGSVTSEFNPSEDHFGIDIVAPKDEAIKATLAGTVIFAEWTVETGYVIQLQHANNLTSIYKHNSVLLKKTGNKVKAGEAIAIVGNSGKLTTGPHLHFELWRNGTALDPKKYINFE